MIVLAIDTSAAATAALVSGERLVAERTEFSARRHVEFIGPVIRELLEAGPRPEAVVVGIGPGPFTGLRAGIAAGTGAAIGLGVPLHGVVSHDALALRGLSTAAGSSVRPLTVVATDARRREVYASAYSGLDEAGLPVRTAGPGVLAPAALAEELRERGASSEVRRLGRGFALWPDALGAPDADELAALEPTAEWLGRYAHRALGAGRALPGAEPLYLRDPDAKPAERRTTLLA
ncbi:tRNA (adenosine(37)-N6)-threonylcarbamoyltransferase complex dimerization subunit type 1 TsaB [Brevibacterium album]|uniref:tRNA (adenosine(37)-N6)-threonylcarbamoyltransferase complex dimerization subunit type 1 TsaB n=1 Tax=Brevibacterium album TaxID=417948 RepID=UPI000405CF44|nr:tRNA (adenosine(37)-N6)-threonylcarbamoyltransferase complex dimerization subunit type 1 TsaB [Brevibacterium album]